MCIYIYISHRLASQRCTGSVATWAAVTPSSSANKGDSTTTIPTKQAGLAARQLQLVH